MAFSSWLGFALARPRHRVAVAVGIVVAAAALALYLKGKKKADTDGMAKDDCDSLVVPSSLVTQKACSKALTPTSDVPSRPSPSSEVADEGNNSWTDLVEEGEEEKAITEMTKIRSKEVKQTDKSFTEEKLVSQLKKLTLNSPMVAITADKDTAARISTAVPVHCSFSKSADSGVASPVEANYENSNCAEAEAASTKKRSDSSGGGMGGSDCSGSINGAAGVAAVTREPALSDSGQGSEPDDGTIMVFQFQMPGDLTGKLIGLGGQFVKSLKAATRCNVRINHKPHSYDNQNRVQHQQHRHSSSSDNHFEEFEELPAQPVMIEGTRSQIDKCLDMIRARFCDHPEVTLEQTNAGTEMRGSTHRAIAQRVRSPQHLLVSGTVHQVYVSAIESACHIFVQQPMHPTYYELKHLEECMRGVYSQSSSADDEHANLAAAELQEGLVCVAQSDKQWYRVQIVSVYPEHSSCDVKFLDYGGYESRPFADLKKIRSDFLKLPFQAIECYLANVALLSSDQNPASGADALRDLIINKTCFGRLNCFAEGSIPFLDLYYITQPSEANEEDAGPSDQHVLVNRELVQLGAATWYESITAQQASAML